MRRSARRCLAPVVMAVVATGACGSKSTGPKVGVLATSTTCEPASTRLAAGRTTFVVANRGNETTELYVLQGTRTLAEVENVGPGTSRQLTVTLRAGSYDLACKPGGKGEGIKAPVTVTEAGSTNP